jgi:predicted RNA-binding protein with PUA-like domain
MSPAQRARRYWLVKSEPNCFSFDDLLQSRDRTTCWDGVRNYQARNFMRDDMKAGDLAFFYHSSAEPPAIVGVAEVVREGYPDHTAFDPREEHFDPKSREESPTWIMVDLRAVERFARPLTLADLRSVAGLEKMVLLQRGSRLSVQPVSEAEWEIVHGLGNPGPVAEPVAPKARRGRAAR